VAVATFLLIIIVPAMAFGYAIIKARMQSDDDMEIAEDIPNARKNSLFKWRRSKSDAKVK